MTSDHPAATDWLQHVEKSTKLLFAKTCAEFLYNRILDVSEMDNPVLIHRMRQPYETTLRTSATPEQCVRSMVGWLRGQGSLSEPVVMARTLITILQHETLQQVDEMGITKRNSNPKIKLTDRTRQALRAVREECSNLLQRTKHTTNTTHLIQYKSLVRELRPDHVLIRQQIEGPMVQQLRNARRAVNGTNGTTFRTAVKLTQAQLGQLRKDIPRLQLVEQQFELLEMCLGMTEEELDGFEGGVTEVNVKFLNNLKNLVVAKKSGDETNKVEE